MTRAGVRFLWIFFYWFNLVTRCGRSIGLFVFVHFVAFENVRVINIFVDFIDEENLIVREGDDNFSENCYSLYSCLRYLLNIAVLLFYLFFIVSVFSLE